MNNYLEIAGRRIGADYEPVVIAEIGINHGGDLDLAISMVDEAKKAGAEIIKHQTHIVEDEMSKDAKNIIPSHTDLSIYQIMQDCALNEDHEKKLMDYVISKEIIFISTPFSKKAADRLRKFNIPAYKIGSGECNNYPLIDYISDFGKPMIISTGMNSISSIAPTVSILRKKKLSFALLHCTNIYPTPHKLVRLNAISELKDAFPDAVIGLSDHTISNNACLGSVALGASILERHFTDTLDREGPDIVCSMDGKALSELIEGSKEIYLTLGGKKEPIKEEEGTINFAFASVVAIKNIKKDEKFTKENIWLKRPGTGDFLAKDYDKLLGKLAKNNIEKDTQISKSDIC